MSKTLSPLTFNSLNIKREEFGKEKGMLRAQVTVNLFESSLQVTLPDEVATDMMRLITPHIAGSVTETLTAVAGEAEALIAGNTVEATALPAE